MPISHIYQERLTPSLWTFVAVGVLSPMVALTFLRVNPVLATLCAIVTIVIVFCSLHFFAPVITVNAEELRAGRAHIPIRFLGEVQEFTGEEAKKKRGQEFDPRAWHLFRGGISGIVIIEIADTEDPTPSWYIASRTPDRFAAALRTAKLSNATQHTPGK